MKKNDNKNWLDNLDNLEAPLEVSKKDNNQNKTKSITYPKEWEDRIKKNKSGLNISAFIRQAIVEKLEKDNL